jgi:hypothetical protein
MRGKILTWLGAACGVTIVACSSVSAEQACTDLAGAVCTKVSECATPLFNEVYGNVATCQSRQAAACQKGLALPTNGDTPGFAEDCSKSYATATCTNVLQNTQTTACTRTTFGTVGDGGACGTDGQCLSGKCQTDSTTGCGKCIEPLGAGQTCQSTSDCQSGLTCVVTATNPTASTCVAPAASGKPCSNTSPVTPCQSGLLCVSGTCTAPLAAGSACDPKASQCDAASGYWCTPVGTRCVPVLYAAAGQPCGYDSTTGDLTACSGGGGGGLLGACMNIDKTTGKGTCAGAAADGAPCDNTNGPFCMPPALCLNGACTVVDPATCN